MDKSTLEPLGRATSTAPRFFIAFLAFSSRRRRSFSCRSRNFRSFLLSATGATGSSSSQVSQSSSSSTSTADDCGGSSSTSSQSSSWSSTCETVGWSTKALPSSEAASTDRASPSVSSATSWTRLRKRSNSPIESLNRPVLSHRRTYHVCENVVAWRLKKWIRTFPFRVRMVLGEIRNSLVA